MNFNLLFISLTLIITLFEEQPHVRSTHNICISDSTVQWYENEIRTWHERRVANLNRDHGWLTLVALDWLKNGTNELPSIGTIMVDSGSVSVHLASEIQATVGGKPFSGGMVRTDANQGGADKIEFGTRAFVVIKRGDNYAVRMWDTSAKPRKKFNGIERFPVSHVWRIEARWLPYESPKQIKVPSVIPGYDQEYPVPGVAVFTIEGKEYRLEPVLEPGEEDLFFIFGDKTNGKETYGAGRFLYAKPPRDGKVIIDFNKAYNPPCAFTPYATCPLPPTSNRLAIRIEAGEKTYGEH